MDGISVLPYQCAKEGESLHKKARSKKGAGFFVHNYLRGLGRCCGGRLRRF